jgi:hydroxypyruvate reductase
VILPGVRDAGVLRAVLDAVAGAADPSRVTDAFCRRIDPTKGALRVLAVGKAGVTMARAAAGVFGDRLSAGLVVGPEAHTVGLALPRWAAMASDHPLPTERSVAAADAVARFVAAGDERLIVLISGGGSAMTVSPAPGVPLAALRAAADAMMRAGASIDELNAVRKHLDLTKGGGLALAARGRETAVGVLSDVMGDRLDVISSGPFAPDPTTFADAAAVLSRYRVCIPDVDTAIAEGLAGHRPETPKPGDARLASVTHEILASNATVARAAAASLRARGLAPEVRLELRGEAREWGGLAAEALRSGVEAIVLGGESVVRGVPPGARGGPVQEAVLTAGLALRDLPGWLVIGFATDGIDGPTDAAGAALDPMLLAAVPGAASALTGHNSHPALEAAGALIRTGPTGTNLNDVLVAIRSRPAT